MPSKKYKILTLLILLVILFAIALVKRQGLLTFWIPFVFAHCDTMDGPVIQAAKKALETKDVKPILIWVQKKDEAEIREAFEKTLTVRKLNPQAQELADMYFFETLVRIHRAGEGAPYIGLKAAGSEVEPGIVAADKALESGSVDTLIKDITTEVASGLRERFERVMEGKKHMRESVEAGREYVEAYVEFIHYVERLHLDVSSKASHHSESKDKEVEGHHAH